MILKAITSKKENALNGSLDDPEDENIQQYKDMIREQDKRCNELAEENEKLREQLRNYTVDLEELRKYMYDMQQQNAQLKLQVRN